ncbi:DNA polymerase III subunit alpha [Paenibacillus cremeus]|uniref:DNA polymerase III subunit alpha n=1 Tax=Paenibacillus cremeus TaxID=2163881 RepID=UPI001648C830|nr:DNA polymerase III subunit alpha [Paenibacillus cremeus]
MSKRFSSLHNHTYYSLLDAVMSPKELVEQAYNLNFNSIAITEHGSMHSFVEGYKAAKKLGIKFIAGCEVYETSDMNYKEKDADRYHLILLAKSDLGLKNLFKIVTEGATTGFYGKPRVDLNLMSYYSEDIICMTACLGSRIDRLLYGGRCSCCSDGLAKDECYNFVPDYKSAKKWVGKYKEVFGDNFYIELQSHDTEASNIANQRLLKLANDTSTKYTITFDTHIRDGSELQKDVHRKFIQISQDREVGETYEGCWQTDIDTIHSVMDKQIGHEAVEIGIDTSDEIASQCNLEIQLHRELMPKIKIPDMFESEQKYLQHLVRTGWMKRGWNKFSPEQKKLYKERLEKEFEVLDYLGYCSYFIMLAQLVDKMKERKIPLGYSRGSGGNSLTLYAIGVTEIDSIKWDLDFSRFANKGRKGSAADYDLDMSQLRRQEALEIASELFGQESIAQVATFNSLSPKVCIRDLGKIFDEEGTYKIPYDIRDKISKLIPDDAQEKMTIERALEKSDELQSYERQYPLLFEYSKYLQNLPKSVGCHASAVIIAPNPVVEYAPLMLNKNGNIMMQIEMHNAMDDIGLVKMDFLGLVTMDVVDKTLELANLTWNDIDLSELDLEDGAVFKEIYAQGNTHGVFQMEAYVAQEMFKKMKADSVYDVFAVNAMNRPAILSVGMDKVYISNKNNPENITYIHDDLRSIFNSTNGIMLYQEQALKVFELAGFPEDERDKARRAIGKKEAVTMKKLFDKFEEGLLARNWTREQIKSIWDLVEAQSTYSFNAGHSTAYGLLSYVTAWLKYHHPVAFMTALLTSEIGDYQQTTKYISECHKMNIKVSPPNINKSDRSYTIHNGEILFGLESLKGVGEKAVEQIINERNNGEFTSLLNFVERCKLDSATIIALIKSGCFGMNKDELLLSYAETLYPISQYKPVLTIPTKSKLFELDFMKGHENIIDKNRLLELYNDGRKVLHNEQARVKREKYINDYREKYMDSPEMYEYETLSIFINGNPFDSVSHFFKPFDEYEEGQICVPIGTITSIKRKKQKNGLTMAYIELLTPDKMIEGMVFAKQYAEYQDILKKGSNIVVRAKKSGAQFVVDQIKTLEVWKRERKLK